jgi:hypothetical protein
MPDRPRSGSVSGMTKLVAFVLAALFTVLAIGLVVLTDVSLSVVVSIGIGALSLLWLLLLLTVPWNVYFQARTVLTEIRTSRERGIEVSPDRDTEAARIAGRMRAVAVGGHLATAAVVAAVTYFAGGEIGYYFAGFYLLSTVFRPAGSWFGHLRSRLSTMLTEVRYPRDDVIDLLSRVSELERLVDHLDGEVAAGRRNHTELAGQVASLDRRSLERDQSLERALAAHGRQFEHSLSRLTDNQEVLAGLKAFLRMVRSDSL